MCWFKHMCLVSFILYVVLQKILRFLRLFYVFIDFVFVTVLKVKKYIFTKINPDFQNNHAQYD